MTANTVTPLQMEMVYIGLICRCASYFPAYDISAEILHQIKLPASGAVIANSALATRIGIFCYHRIFLLFPIHSRYGRLKRGASLSGLIDGNTRTMEM